MKDTNIDFNMIANALKGSIEAMQQECSHTADGLEQLQIAQQELQRALSHSLTNKVG